MRSNSIKTKVMDDLRGFFKPEFLNRVDEIMIFNPLTKEMLRRIVDIQLKTMELYLKQQDIAIVLTEKAKDRLAERGFDQVYGARPLKRSIQREVLNPLATKLLDGTFSRGDVIEVDFEGDAAVFRKTTERREGVAT